MANPDPKDGAKTQLFCRWTTFGSADEADFGQKLVAQGIAACAQLDSYRVYIRGRQGCDIGVGFG